MRDLIRAAERGKQVVVLVEIKARFDEEANIVWARKLEQAGAHVVYGLVGLKTHSKVCLVVRREGSGLRRYVHIGTGNYNPKTARLYTDLGLLSCRPELGADVTDLFNVLTGLSRQRAFRRLLVAPHSLRSRFLELVEREIDHAALGHEARIVVKLNAIVDQPSIEALYRASQAGRPDRRDRPRRVLAPARRARACPRADPRPLDRRRVPRAFADLGLRQRRRAASGTSARPTSWTATSTGGSRRSCRSRTPRRATGSPRSSRSCSPTTAARGSSGPTGAGADGGARGRAGTIDTFEVLKERALAMAARPRPPHRRGPASARWIRARDDDDRSPAAGRDRAEVPGRTTRAGGRSLPRRPTTLGGVPARLAGPSAQVEDRYVDTADGDFARAGFAARLRQTSKGTSVGQVAQGRTGPPATARRASARGARGPCRRTPGPHDWPAVGRALARARACRRRAPARVGHRPPAPPSDASSRRDTRVELSLDEVDVVVRGEVVDRFAELEVELLKGDEARLTALDDGAARPTRASSPSGQRRSSRGRSPR